MNLFNRLKLSRVWRAEYRRVYGELCSYTNHELASDLRLGPSDIDGVAREAADMHLAAFVRAHPEYRADADSFGHHHALGAV